MLRSLMHVRTGREGVISRRTFLRGVTLGAAGLGLGWKGEVALHAEELRKNGMACILLFMRGGPSQLETFDPKPGTANGGETEAIETAASGIHIAELWPKIAKEMKSISLIRSMTSREGEHLRAMYQLHTGYVPSGSVKYPSIGSVVAGELGPQDFDLPHYVSIGSRTAAVGSGFLGMRVAPFMIPNPGQMPNNATLPSGITRKRFGRRLGLLQDLEEDFAHAGGEHRVAEHRGLYENASQMVLSPRLKAFDISQEKDGERDRYGRSSFGQGCLLARRLVEQGVTFVEVESNGWDTHDDNFKKVKSLSETVDPGFAALVGDLRERGMLQKTLVIWMGEFGRTPRINPKAGRDHYPRAFNVALAGAGIRGGQAIGATGPDGMEVKSRPVTVSDLFCTFYEALKINPHKENRSALGRPIKLVDGGKAVKELLG